VAGAYLFFESHGIVQMHLGGPRTEFRIRSPSHLMIHTIAQWARGARELDRPSRRRSRRRDRRLIVRFQGRLLTPPPPLSDVATGRRPAQVRRLDPATSPPSRFVHQRAPQLGLLPRLPRHTQLERLITCSAPPRTPRIVRAQPIRSRSQPSEACHGPWTWVESCTS
jgi:hypothetical protein